MNSYTKITLILLLSSLTTLIHTAKEPTKEMAQYHEDKAAIAGKVAEMSITSLITNGFFEKFYMDLKKAGQTLPPMWQRARRFNRPIMAAAGVVLIGASSTWFYHASSEQHIKEELFKAEELRKAELLKAEEILKAKSKGWFW